MGAQVAEPSPILYNRIFKEARKDKGQDDFLGNVVLRLQVRAGERSQDRGKGRSWRALRDSRSDPTQAGVGVEGRKGLPDHFPVLASALHIPHYHRKSCLLRTCTAERTSGSRWSPARRPTQTAASVTSNSSSFTRG